MEGKSRRIKDRGNRKEKTMADDHRSRHSESNVNESGYIIEGAIPKDQTRILGQTKPRDNLKTIPRQFFSQNITGGGGRGGGGGGRKEDYQLGQFQPLSRRKVAEGEGDRPWEPPRLMSAKECSSHYFDIKVETIREEDEGVDQRCEGADHRLKDDRYEREEGYGEESALKTGDRYVSFMFEPGESDRDAEGERSGVRFNEFTSTMTPAYQD